MKEKIKQILNSIGLYHPLQSSYRSAIHLTHRFITRLVYSKYRGKGFLCNVCNHSFKKFIDKFPSKANRGAILDNSVVAGYGRNILCPHCLSTARDRLVLAMLQQMDLDHKKVLHFSPEKSVFTFLKQKAHVISADIAPGFYKTTDKGVVGADATKLFFFDDGAFDVVVANHIMEHIPDDSAAMREFFRVLQPGGYAILQVPYSKKISTIEQPEISDPQAQSALFGQKDHVRIYSLADYIARLRAVGFQVDELGYEQLSHLYHLAIQKDESFLKIVKPIS